MASFNKVFLMGNLTRDPALKYLPNQTAVVEFGLACNRKWKGPERRGPGGGDVRRRARSSERQAEVINQYFQKGKPIFVQGRLKLDSGRTSRGAGSGRSSPSWARRSSSSEVR
jgi:single-strand DNA-binding protein